MRVGENPMRQKRTLRSYPRHRIVVPVYIPEAEGYYADALRIFRLSIQSLLSTVDLHQVAITVINNASVPEVNDDLERLHARGKIDRYIKHAENRGKPDPVAGELKAAYEDFVTLADADVLFQPGWLYQVEKIYAAFPEAGCVSPFPAPNLRFHFGTSNWLGIVPGSGARLEPLVNDADLEMFEASLGGPKVFSSHDRRLQYAVQRGDVTALLGAGHFVCTLRRELFADLQYEAQLGGISAGEKLIDEHVDRRGFGRLATVKAHVRHMGNTFEQWMQENAPHGLAEPALHMEFESRPKRPLSAMLPYALRKQAARPIYRWAEWRLRSRTGRSHQAHEATQPNQS